MILSEEIIKLIEATGKLEARNLDLSVIVNELSDRNEELLKLNNELKQALDLSLTKLEELTVKINTDMLDVQEGLYVLHNEVRVKGGETNV